MKILIVTDTYYPHVNGASYFCQRLSLLLKANGHDVRVLAPSQAIWTQQTDFQGVPVYGLWSVPLLSYGYRYSPPLFQKKEVRKILEDFQPDVIHCNSHFSPNTVVLPIAQSLHIPVMASNHFVPENLMPYLHIPKMVYPFVRHSFWKHWHHTYKKFDLTVVPTHAAAQIVAINAALAHVEVISNGVDLARFHVRPKDAALMQRYAIDPDIPVLLYVGRLDQEKQVNVLLESLAQVLPHRPCRLLIAGKGSHQACLKALAKELHLENAVTFLGFVSDEDLPSLYSIADCFVIASIAELQSIATLEAMANALPIVVADAMALPELVHSGENGYTFLPGDAASCAESIKKVLSDSTTRTVLGQKSEELVKQHDIHVSIHAFEMLYASLQKTRTA
jgi:1,2-diacylglycerol 3-alpha-glucosyltransferase